MDSISGDLYENIEVKLLIMVIFFVEGTCAISQSDVSQILKK